MKTKRPGRIKRRPRLDFYFIPSMFTAGNAVFGFLSLIYSVKGKFFQAALFIFFASIFDFFDGRIARFLKVSSEFGTELDSLCDAISFGVAPAFLAYFWALKNAEPFAIIIASIFMLAGIIRLARFNVIHLNNPTSNQLYTGLPIPMAASSIYSMVLIHPEPIQSKTFTLFFGFWIILFAYFMISKIRFRSFKELKMKSKNFLPLLFSSIIILGLVYYTGYTIAALLYSYLTYNLIRLLVLRRKKGKTKEYELESEKS